MTATGCTWEYRQEIVAKDQMLAVSNQLGSQGWEVAAAFGVDLRAGLSSLIGAPGMKGVLLLFKRLKVGG